MSNLKNLNTTYHFIYLTTNLINGKKYLGKHSTNNLNDNYLGSGLGIFRAIKKYGKQNFKREILEFCKNSEECFKREYELSKEFNVVSDKTFYNNEYGGRGGFIGAEIEETTKNKISKTLTGRKIDREIVKKISQTKSNWSEERKEKYRQLKSEKSRGDIS